MLEHLQGYSILLLPLKFRIGIVSLTYVST